MSNHFISLNDWADEWAEENETVFHKWGTESQLLRVKEAVDAGLKVVVLFSAGEEFAGAEDILADVFEPYRQAGFRVLASEDQGWRAEAIVAGTHEQFRNLSKTRVRSALECLEEVRAALVSEATQETGRRTTSVPLRVVGVSGQTVMAKLWINVQYRPKAKPWVTICVFWSDPVKARVDSGEDELGEVQPAKAFFQEQTTVFSKEVSDPDAAIEKFKAKSLGAPEDGCLSITTNEITNSKWGSWSSPEELDHYLFRDKLSTKTFVKKLLSTSG